jgi:hypothetical protein
MAAMVKGQSGEYSTDYWKSNEMSGDYAQVSDFFSVLSNDFLNFPSFSL